MSLTLPVNHAYRYAVRNWRVVDADTVFTELVCGFDIFVEQYCRLAGIDCPEHTTKAGKIVASIVGRWCVRNQPLQVLSARRDKYSRRFDGQLFDSTGNESLAYYLLSNGLCREYAGGERKPWTAAELQAVEKRAAELLGV